MSDRSRLCIKEADAVPYHRWTVLTALATAAGKMQEGRYAEAEQHCLRALAELQKRGAPAIDIAQALFVTATNYHSWATHGGPGKFREAEPMYRQALAAREAVSGAGDQFALQTCLTLADLCADWVEAGNVNRLADIEGALQGWLAASGSDSPQTPDVLGLCAAKTRSIESDRFETASLSSWRPSGIAWQLAPA